MPPRLTLEQLVTDEAFDAAYTWLCKRRNRAPDNSDVWSFRQEWPEQKSVLKASLLSGNYRFEPLTCVPYGKNTVRFMWRAQDSLVQKLLVNGLITYLPDIIAPTCRHVKHHGGLKKTVAAVQEALPNPIFFFRSDIKSYYQSISHKRLMRQLKQHINDPRILDLLWHFLRHTLTWAGYYADNPQGLPLGSPLSSWLGALYLKPLDEVMAKEPVFYQRYMDDWVFLSPSRWKLRHAIKRMHACLEALELPLHPLKTEMGRISKGFDFLGYHLSPTQLTLASKTYDNCVDHVHRLYEQQATPRLIVTYLQRFIRWAKTPGCRGP